VRKTALILGDFDFAQRAGKIGHLQGALYPQAIFTNRRKIFFKQVLFFW